VTCVCQDLSGRGHIRQVHSLLAVSANLLQAPRLFSFRDHSRVVRAVPGAVSRGTVNLRLSILDLIAEGVCGKTTA
jgi:hypothetical protein